MLDPKRGSIMVREPLRGRDARGSEGREGATRGKEGEIRGNGWGG